MPPIIALSSLHKHFSLPVNQPGLKGMVRGFLARETRLVRAVDGITFEIQPGEMVGYLGPNGAGKSTTIKMLTGLLVPTGGEIIVNGHVPWRERQKYVAGIGAVFGQRTTLWWDLPVIESLELLQYIYKIPPDRFRNNLNEFRDILELDPFIQAPTRALSLGQRMRADLAAALLHDPAILFLDEPTIGLDVVAKERIRQFIQYVNRARGTTVLLTTHDLSDVEKLCERVMIIDHGKLLFDGKLDSLQNRFGGKRELIVDFAESYADMSIPGAEVRSTEGLRATYQFDRAALSASELIRRLTERFRIVDLSVREPDIEATIRRIYEERLLDTGE